VFQSVTTYNKAQLQMLTVEDFRTLDSKLITRFKKYVKSSIACRSFFYLQTI